MTCKRVIKMFHNKAFDDGSMVSIYKHKNIEDCITQFDRDFANRHNQHTAIEDYKECFHCNLIDCPPTYAGQEANPRGDQGV